MYNLDRKIIQNIHPGQKLKRNQIIELLYIVSKFNIDSNNNL